MAFMVFKIALSAIIIAFTSWLSGKRPELAGFIIALPVASLLVLVFSYAEYKDPQATITFAKSICLAVPLSLTFFIPFFLADKLHLSFIASYASGLALLVVAYFIHHYITQFF